MKRTKFRKSLNRSIPFLQSLLQHHNQREHNPVKRNLKEKYNLCECPVEDDVQVVHISREW